MAEKIQELHLDLRDRRLTREALNENATKAEQRVQDRAAEVIAKVKAKEKLLLDEITTQDRAAEVIAQVKAEEKLLLDEITTQDRAAEVIAQVKAKKERLLVEIKSQKREQYERIREHHALEPTELRVQPTPKAVGLKSYPVFVQSRKLGIDLGMVMVEDTWEMSHSFGVRGSGEGEFEGARGIAAAACRDEIAVTDGENDRVVICNNQGQTKSTIPIVASDVAAISNQWVCAQPRKVMVYHRETKHKFDVHTVPKDEVGKTVVWLASVAVMRNGNIIVGDEERKVLTEHNPRNGKILHTMPVNIPPSFLAVLSNGRIAISNREQGLVEIVKVSYGKAVTVTRIQPTIDGEPVKHCGGVCSDRPGFYLVVDTDEYDTGHIHHYTRTGQFVSCVAQGLYNPYGITITADGLQLAVADGYSVKMYYKM